MSLQKLGSLLHPVGEERAFWSAVAALCKDESPATWSFETWDNVLELARIKGLAAQTERGVDRDGNLVREFVGSFGEALLRRYRWARDARERGLTPRQAEAEFSGRVERERADFQRQQAEMNAHRAREIEDASRRARRKPASESGIS